MIYTDNYQLRKPQIGVDKADVKDLNFNSDRIDTIMHNTQISMATAYDATRTSENPYNTGDITMHELIAYRCKEDGVYGPWDASKWEQTTLADNLGGGGGASVIANPSGTPADTLESLEVDDVIYNIPSINDKGVEDESVVLYATEINTNSGSFTLNQSINAFDVITIYFGIDGDPNGAIEPISLYVSDIKEICKTGCIALTGYGKRYMHITIRDKILTVLRRDGDGSTVVIFKVIGHKNKLAKKDNRVLELVYSARDRNTSDTKTYTADENCRLLVANININGEASTKTLLANITTTGSIVATWTNDAEWSSPNRNRSMTWAIIDVSVGDTVSLETQTNGSYTNQVRAIWKIADINVSEITSKEVFIQADGNLPTSNTYTLSSDGIYLMWAIKTSGNGNTYGASDVSISTTPSTKLDSDVFSAGNAVFCIAIAENPTSLEADITSSSSYCSRGYGVLQLGGAS